ncbi:hypothetical protein AXF42_Ash010794 [Apostasia shenzhenica]|uniref:Uncharacterized protein n=1 Tax=Apostasia shenzhenica TaxID=1088818 RepID=A0A2I0A0N4_9ASPA|nr:hypothetical protein AXF42_Ash010794 [Apostasia shenzhenica]
MHALLSYVSSGPATRVSCRLPVTRTCNFVNAHAARGDGKTDLSVRYVGLSPGRLGPPRASRVAVGSKSDPSDRPA